MDSDPMLLSDGIVVITRCIHVSIRAMLPAIVEEIPASGRWFIVENACADVFILLRRNWVIAADNNPLKILKIKNWL